MSRITWTRSKLIGIWFFARPLVLDAARVIRRTQQYAPAGPGSVAFGIIPDVDIPIAADWVGEGEAVDQPSSRRLNENDKPLVYPADCEVKRVSSSGFLAHEGKSYHVGEPFAHKCVGLHLNAQGQTELYFANVHLGNLTYGSAGRFRRWTLAK